MFLGFQNGYKGGLDIKEKNVFELIVTFKYDADAGDEGMVIKEV